MKPITKYSDRFLNLFGTMLLGQEVRVFLSDRLTRPLVVALESRSVGLHPEMAHLFDLCLGARLLRHRAKGEKAQDKMGQMPRGKVRRWVDQESRQLRADFSNIGELPGFYRDHNQEGNERLPLVVWRDLPFKPQDWSGPLSGSELVDTPGIQFDTAGQDLRGLLEAIRAGRYPLEQLPGFPLPVATVPVRVNVSQAYPAELEGLEAALKEVKYLEESFMSCYTRKSQGALDTQVLPQRQLSGARLDSACLARAVIAQKRNRPVRLFRAKERDLHPIFDPRDHLAVYAFDLNGMHAEPGQRSWNPRQVAFLARVFERLKVDFTLMGYADRVLDVGRPVYLHVPVMLKTVADPFDGAFWSRLARVVLGQALKDLPGEPACYHPLHLRHIDTVLRAQEKEQSHSFRCLIWGAPRGLPASLEDLRGPIFQRATAEIVDAQIARWKRDFEGARFDTDFLYLPPELKFAGKKGGAAANAQSL